MGLSSATCLLNIKRISQTESSLNAVIKLLIEISTSRNEKQVWAPEGSLISPTREHSAFRALVVMAVQCVLLPRTQHDGVQGGVTIGNSEEKRACRKIEINGANRGPLPAPVPAVGVLRPFVVPGFRSRSFRNNLTLNNTILMTSSPKNT